MEKVVTKDSDSGYGSLRQAIEDINSGNDTNNKIVLKVTNNRTIRLTSDLPVITKNTVIISISHQTIDGNGNRLFATIMADLTINNCTLINGIAVGGHASWRSAGGGGLSAGGGIYIDRGNTLTLIRTNLRNCKAKGGNGGQGKDGVAGAGAGASFSIGEKNNIDTDTAGGDFPAVIYKGGKSDGSSFLKGYGGGRGAGKKPGKGGGNGAGENGNESKGGDGGYCGGGGGFGALNVFNSYQSGGGGGGNGGGNGHTGGGGFGSECEVLLLLTA